MSTKIRWLFSLHALNMISFLQAQAWFYESIVNIFAESLAWLYKIWIDSQRSMNYIILYLPYQLNNLSSNWKVWPYSNIKDSSLLISLIKISISYWLNKDIFSPQTLDTIEMLTNVLEVLIRPIYSISIIRYHWSLTNIKNEIILIQSWFLTGLCKTNYSW